MVSNFNEVLFIISIPSVLAGSKPYLVVDSQGHELLLELLQISDTKKQIPNLLMAAKESVCQASSKFELRIIVTYFEGVVFRKSYSVTIRFTPSPG